LFFKKIKKGFKNNLFLINLKHFY